MSEQICMKFSGKVGNGSVNKWLNLTRDPDHRLDTGIVSQIRHYWEIRKVVNGYRCAAHTDSPDGGTGIGKTCLGGGIRCPSAFSWVTVCKTVRPMLSYRCLFCLSMLSVCLSVTVLSLCLSCL